LVIAGSSSDAGAGVQIDIKTAHSIGVHACTVITCITAQNTKGVQKVELTKIFEEQLTSVLDDIPITCVKFGVVPDQKQFDVYKKLCKGIPFVLDPVMVAEADTFAFVKEKEKLIEMGKLPECVLMTPNVIECERLVGINPKSVQDARLALSKFKESGIKNCIIKGIKEEHSAIFDLLWLDTKELLFKKPQRPFRYHGSGCCFASAIASYYTLTGDIEKSVVLAESFIENAISKAVKIGKGDVLVVMP